MALRYCASIPRVSDASHLTNRTAYTHANRLWWSVVSESTTAPQSCDASECLIQKLQSIQRTPPYLITGVR